MNAYLTLVRSLCTSQQAIDHHMLYYVRTELALHKIQFCRDLKVYQQLNHSYRERFNALTNHIIAFTKQQAEQLELDELHLAEIQLLLDQIAACNFDKDQLDLAITGLHDILVQKTIELRIDDLAPKVISLSA